MTTQKTKPLVAVIGTGGTISTLARHPLDYVEYADGAPNIEVNSLLELVPEVAEQAEIRPVSFGTATSSRITPRDWLKLNDLVHRVAASDVPPHGIVIVHGTSTLEETAYFLDLSLKTDVPVVVVGSQRPLGTLSTDAPLNLVNAVRAAASPNARGLGVLVLMNGDIQGAREVTKCSNYRLEAFRSPELGILGYADADGTIVFYRAPTRRHAPDAEFDVRGARELPRVDITYSYAGSDGTAVEALVDAGARGIVCASLPPGVLAGGERDAVAAARRKGVLIVVSSRALGGRVLSRESLRRHGIVAADNLSPQKARILLMLGLTVTGDSQEIQRMFDEY